MEERTESGRRRGGERTSFPAPQFSECKTLSLRRRCSGGRGPPPPAVVAEAPTMEKHPLPALCNLCPGFLWAKGELGAQWSPSASCRPAASSVLSHTGARWLLPVPSPHSHHAPESEETSYSGFFEKCEDLCEISLIRSLFRGISAAPPIDDFSFLDCADQLQSTKLSPSCDIRFDRGHLAPSLPPHQCDLSFDFPSPRLAIFCRINSPRMISSIPLPFSSSGRLLSREQSL